MAWTINYTFPGRLTTTGDIRNFWDFYHREGPTTAVTLDINRLSTAVECESVSAQCKETINPNKLWLVNDLLFGVGVKLQFNEILQQLNPMH